MTEEFIQHRTYLEGVSQRTVEWYRCSFRAFEGALESKQTIIGRIAQIKERGTSHITINSYLRAVNAYFMWLHEEGHVKELVKIPKLKEEEKVLATLSKVSINLLLSHNPKGWKARNMYRAHLVALVALDCGLRASEILGLPRENCDFENCVFKVLGKGGMFPARFR